MHVLTTCLQRKISVRLQCSRTEAILTRAAHVRRSYSLVRCKWAQVRLFRSQLGVGQCAYRALLVRSTYLLGKVRLSYVRFLDSWIEEVPSKHGRRTEYVRGTRHAEQVTMGFVKKTRRDSALCARVRTGDARHPNWGESVARIESSTCTKHATSCLRAPKFVCSSHHVRIPEWSPRFCR